MGNTFSGSEIVEIGVEIEKNGRDFYQALTEKAKSPQAAELFEFLSAEEEKHIKVFEKILETLDQYDPPESYPGEYFTYMSNLAGGYVFTQKNKGKEIAGKIKTDKEALEMGIGFEKDSIVFYEGMKKAVPNYDLKVVDELINQEKSHLSMLTDLNKKL